MILAGDVGGTKTILGLFRKQAGALESVREETFRSADYASLEAIVRAFMDGERRAVDRAAVGVAGPVVGGRSQVVNLRWPVDRGRLDRVLGISGSRVLNDVEANAWGIPELPARRFRSLTPGLRAGPGNAALIAAGTGLGMALLVRDPDAERFIPAASEGGHQEFGPRDDLEIELLRFMRQRHGRVSTERIVCGAGFSAIYQFLIESGRGHESPAMARRIAAADDPNAEISRAGLDGDDPVAERTLDLFVSLFGSAAGDLALVARATGGMFVGGGIAPKILPRLERGGFVQSFRTKGRLSPLLESIPVKVIQEPRTALIGAAACAARTR